MVHKVNVDYTGFLVLFVAFWGAPLAFLSICGQSPLKILFYAVFDNEKEMDWLGFLSGG